MTELMAHAQHTPTVEVCGLIGRGPDGDSIYTATNVATEPKDTFELAPEDQIAAFKSMRHADEQLLAIYHSHPDEAAIPSTADRTGLGYPSAFTLILAPTEPRNTAIRAWQSTTAGFVETSLVRNG